MTRSAALVVGLLAASAIATTVLGQGLTRTIPVAATTGGGASSGGRFELHGAAGQADAGILTSGRFTLFGGAISPADAPVPPSTPTPTATFPPGVPTFTPSPTATFVPGGQPVARLPIAWLNQDADLSALRGGW